MYTGWLLPAADRAKLLGEFPPCYPDVIAHHVTLQMSETELPTETSGIVVGHIDDYEGSQVLIVQINGSTIRPDGNTYHITWSIDREFRKPMDSNDVIRQHGWEPIETPIEIKLVPAVMD